VLVNDVWGGDALVDWGTPFWRQDMADVRTLVERAVLSHWITARHMAPMMVEANRGLIVEVTDGETPGYRGQILYDFVKASVNRLAYAMAWDLARTGVTALAVSPGFLRSEAILDGFGVSEANWREAVSKNEEFAYSETPHYLGRAIAALAADPNVGAKAGAAFFAADLADEYGFTDLDGARPHFTHSVDARLRSEMAASEPLGPWARRHAAAAYMRAHLMPAEAETARAYAARLGWTRLGAGLRPVG